MLKKLIIIENGEQVQCDSKEELVKILIDENYYNLTNDEKTQKMEMKALANTFNLNINISKENLNDGIEGKFIIKDEFTYILSLVLTNKILLLERIDSNIFTGNINKEKITDNYIIVNKYAYKILKEYIENDRI